MLAVLISHWLLLVKGKSHIIQLMMKLLQTIIYTYFSFVTIGQRWPILDDPTDTGMAMLSSEWFFWKWFEGVQQHQELHDCGVKVALTEIHGGFTSKTAGGNYPFAWKVGKSKAAVKHRQAKCREQLGTTVKTNFYSYWNADQNTLGGATMNVCKPTTTKKCHGMYKCTCYANGSARVLNGTCKFQINYSQCPLCPRVIDFKRNMKGLNVWFDRNVQHHLTYGSHARVECKHRFTFLENDVHQHYQTDMTRDKFRAILFHFIHQIMDPSNNMFSMVPATEEECYTFDQLRENIIHNEGRALREFFFHDKRSCASICNTKDMRQWYSAVIGRILCSVGYASMNLHKWVEQWKNSPTAYDPDCLKEAHDLYLERRRIEPHIRPYLDVFGNLTSKGKCIYSYLTFNDRITISIIYIHVYYPTLTSRVCCNHSEVCSNNSRCY